MIEYCIYRRDEHVIMYDNKPLTTLEGTFTNENSAKIFLKAIRKEYPSSEKVTYFMDKWDTDKKTFIK